MPYGDVGQTERWSLRWADEFDGKDPDGWRHLWHSQAGPSGHILSSRYPENLRVQDGCLKLLNRREARGGQMWTSGNVWSKEQFLYGYFEARYRYAPAHGLNQSFWIMSLETYTGPKGSFEIDVNEGRYPNVVTTNYHIIDENGVHRWDNQFLRLDLDLSADFHVYGLYWDAHELRFYFDGQMIRRTINYFAHTWAPVRLSSAVVPWAGPITDAIDGTSMDVDYVRVFAIE